LTIFACSPHPESSTTEYFQDELSNPSVREEVIDHHSEITSVDVFIKQRVNRRARPAHDHNRSPPIMRHPLVRGVSNTAIRRGAVNKKSLATNDLNRMTEIVSAKHVPGDTLELSSMLISRVEILGFQKLSSVWRLPCHSIFIVDTSVALDPRQLWSTGINGKEDCEFVRS
jgi:hypothetical protein